MVTNSSGEMRDWIFADTSRDFPSIKVNDATSLSNVKFLFLVVQISSVSSFRPSTKKWVKSFETFRMVEGASSWIKVAKWISIKRGEIISDLFSKFGEAVWIRRLSQKSPALSHNWSSREQSEMSRIPHLSEQWVKKWSKWINELSVTWSVEGKFLGCWRLSKASQVRFQLDFVPCRFA